MLLVPRCTFVYHYFTAVPFPLIALLSAYSRLCGSPRLQNPIFSRTVRGHNGRADGRAERDARVPRSAPDPLRGLYPVLTGTLTTQDYANALGMASDLVLCLSAVP